MFFLFFPLPFSVNSVPSALASVKNKISLTMRSPPCLASIPSPTVSAPLLFLPWSLEAAALPLGVPLHTSSHLPSCLSGLAQQHLLGNGVEMGGEGNKKVLGTTESLSPPTSMCVFAYLTCECFCGPGQVGLAPMW